MDFLGTAFLVGVVMAFFWLISRDRRLIAIVATVIIAILLVGHVMVTEAEEPYTFWFVDCKEVVDESVIVHFGYDSTGDEAFDTNVFSPEGGTVVSTTLPLQLVTDNGRIRYEAIFAPEDTGLQFMFIATDVLGQSALMPINFANLRWCDDTEIYPTLEPTETQPAPEYTPTPEPITGPWDCEDWEAYDPGWNVCYTFEPNDDGTVPLPPLR